MLNKLIAMRDRWRKWGKNPNNGPFTAGYAESKLDDASELDALIQECEGCVCLPREPTEEQRLAGLNVAMDYDADPRLTAPIYQAMVAEAEQKE